MESKEITVKLYYHKSKQDKEAGIYYGGVKEPLYLNELQIDIWNDESYDFEKDKFVPNGKIAMQLSGSNRALKQFGIYLINVAMYQTHDPDYHDHFDNLHTSDGKETVNLIVRKQPK